MEKSEAEVIQAIHLVSGKKPLSPHQVGRRLWTAEYKGRTIGEWAAEVWEAKEADMASGSFATSNRHGRDVLLEIGIGAFCVEYRYLHFYDMNKLIKALPEMGLWATTLRGWEGVLPGGVPLLNEEAEEKRTAVKLSVVKS